MQPDNEATNTPDSTSPSEAPAAPQPRVITPEVNGLTSQPTPPNDAASEPMTTEPQATNIPATNGETTALPPLDSPAPETATTPPPAVTSNNSAPKRFKKSWLFILAVIILLLALGAGYAFAFYLPNQPGNVYKSALKNSGLAVDKLVDYSKTQQAKPYKSTTFTTDIKVKSSSASFDATLQGDFDKNGNGQAKLQSDVEGKKINAELRSVHTNANKTPDVYVQVNGIKSFLDGFGLTSLDSLDGQWIAIDHTLIDTYTSNLKKVANAGDSGSSASSITPPTSDQFYDAANKVQTVNKQYLFTTDSSKAVLKQQKFVGKETKEGRSQDHFTVGYDKQHFKAYLEAVKTALDSSKLNDWSKQANGGKNLSDMLRLSDLETTINNSNGNYTFDLWADVSTKLVSSLRFGDPSNATNTFTISQQYTGGSNYPFSVKVTSKDTTMTLGLTLDTAHNKASGTFAGSGNGTDISGSFSLEPSNNSVTVSAPSGAKPVMDIFQSLGLGSLGSDLTTSSLGPTANPSSTLRQPDPLTLTQ